MKKRLYRSRKHRMIGGVAGGIAEYFDIDPVIVRAVFIISTLAWGTSILVYIVLWIIVPSEEKLFGEARNTSPATSQDEVSINTPPASFQEGELALQERREKRMILAGVILIMVGIMFLFDNLFDYSIFTDFWPLLLVAFGVYILMKHRNYETTEEVK